MARAGGLLSVALAVSSAAMVSLDPPWVLSEANLRAVVSVPDFVGSAFLIKIPREPLGDRAFAGAFGPERQPLPVRLVHAHSLEQWWMIRTGPGLRGRQAALYWSESTAPAPSEVSLADPRPIRLEIFRPAGGNAPNSWSRMQYLLDRSPRIVDAVDLATFKAVVEEAKRRIEGSGPPERRRGMPLHLFRMRTWVLAPVEEVARFAIASNVSAFLLLDGQVIAEEPYGTSPIQWRVGPAVPIGAGVHRMELVLAGREMPELQVGWLTGDATNPQPIPAERLLTATHASHLRLEHRRQALIADFVYETGFPYRFREHPTVFTPVQVFSRSKSRLGAEVSIRWRWPDGATADGPVAGRTLISGGPWAVTLGARDGFGLTATLTRVIDPPPAVPVIHPIHARLEGLPAAVFDSDRAQPCWIIEGEAPRDMTFELYAAVEHRGRVTREIRRTIRGRELPCFHLTEPLAMAAADQIHWALRHEGVDIIRETVRIGEATAGRLKVVGDALWEMDGPRWVWVARSSSRPPIRLTVDNLFGRIVCIDDTLSPEGSDFGGDPDIWHRRLARLLDGPDRPEARLLRPPRPELFPEAHAPLLKLTLHPETVMRRPTLVVVSLALRDLLFGLDVDAFERQAAVLTDRLLNVAPVVWVTPPPFPDLLPRVRDYAAAIHRVARGRGVPVVDLFTTFVGAGALQHPAEWFLPGTVYLTPRGRDLAAEETARALLEAVGEVAP